MPVHPHAQSLFWGMIQHKEEGSTQLHSPHRSNHCQFRQLHLFPNLILIPSGGVGILFKDSFFEEYSVDIVDKTHEDIMWVSCTHFTNLEHMLFICACYLPPAASSRGDKSHECFDILKQQIIEFQDKGEIMICGDFNARIGGLNDNVGGIALPQREILDTVTNSHGRQLVDFLRDCDMVTLNGRFSPEMDNFTVLSTLGRSVVDYAIVQSGCFSNYCNFKVGTMLNLLDDLNIPIDSSIPDHSLLMWEYSPKYTMLSESHQNSTQTLQGSGTTNNVLQPKSFRIQNGRHIFRPDSDGEENIDKLIKELEDLANQNMDISDTRLQNNYSSFYHLIEREFSSHKTHYRSSKKPWWNYELNSLRKEVRLSQNDWNRSKNTPDRMRFWQRYREKQRKFNQCI